VSLKNNPIQNSTAAAAAVPVNNKALLTLSFVEGCSVMVAELAGGKMLAPYYGTSLYVWASTLAITLGGLTLGYYLGGEWSKKELPERRKKLFQTIAIASALVIIMPALANFIMERTLDMSFLTGLVVSQLVFLFPPILGMGIVSPLLISLLGENNNSGKAAGLVYAVSTLGGVIATLLTGFFLVPVLGIAIPCVVIGALLFLLNIFILRPGKKIVAAGGLLLLLPSLYFIKTTREDLSDKYKVLYHTEGMLGQVKVVDFNYTVAGKQYEARTMLVNNNWQTWVDKNDFNFSFLYYTRFTKAVISAMPANSRALLIGLGGGTVAKQLESRNVDYDVVEIDGRLPMLAEKYFGLKHAIKNTVIDDGRHYINVCKKKYDLIIIDALLGDKVPSHLLSVESFVKLKNLLNTNGKVFIEFDGIAEGTDGTAQQALLNTVKKAGYQAKTYSPLPGTFKYDVMYLLTLNNNTSYDTAHTVADSYYPISRPLNQFEMPLETNIETVITDDNPSLDYFLRERKVAFRENEVYEHIRDFTDDGVPMFR
jgi:spermidine synthase